MAPPARFMVLVYRMPVQPTTHRVAVWRHLKKLGAVYLQQSACCFPDAAAIRRELRPILQRIEEAHGEYHLLPLRQLPPDEQRKLADAFLAQAAKHYDEIIEDCEVNFQKEIEFETFRENFTYEEAEEIRNEFEKISQWFERVRARDWFGAPNREEASRWLRRCEQLLEEFEARVYEVQTASGAEPDAGKAAERAPRRAANGRRRLRSVAGGQAS